MSIIWDSRIVLAKELKDSSFEVVGTVKDKEPSWYAIAGLAGGHKKLYAKGDIFCADEDITKCLRIIDIKQDTLLLEDVNSRNNIVLKAGERIPLAQTEIIFEKTVEADVIEYGYKPSEKLTRSQVEDFVVKNLDRKRVVLQKERNRNKKNIDADSEKLSAGLFEKIGTKKISKDTWLVDKQSAGPALDNAGAALLSAIKKVEPGYRFGEGPSLKFDSELGVCVLNKEGFLVQRLAVAKLAEKTGIKEGDLIKSINGYPVNSLLGLYKAYQDVASNAKVRLVSVDIIREGEPKTLIYKIK